VVAREAVELNGDLKNGPTIGAGPFILEKYEPGSGSYFTRNPAYYDPELPRLDRLEILTSFTDPAAALAAFRTKRVDVMRGVGAEDVEAVKRQHPEAMASLARHTAPKVITVRQDKPPFNDVRVRRALSKAVDRQQLIDAAYGGWGWLHTGVIPTGLEESELAVQGEEVQRWARRDLAEAKRLLAEAGYGSGLSIEMLVGKREAGDVPAAELLASQLKEAGVTANLRALENAQFVQQVLTRADYNEAAYGGRTLGTTVGQLFNSNLLSTSSRNADKINDPELDRLITEQATMRDKEQRKRVVLAIQRRALENANFITVAGAVRAVLIWPRVRDYWDGAPNENQRFAYAWLSE